MSFNYLEFFAGGGMVRAALDSQWTCLYANDFDPKKAATYSANWLAATSFTFSVEDIANVHGTEIPGLADLAWASFPCQDLSLAGSGRGLSGARSGTFWPWIQLVGSLRAQNRPPRVLVVENVLGTLTSHGGKDFAAIADALSALDYVFGALVVDASLFLPQSRPRLFIVAFDPSLTVPPPGIHRPQMPWHPPAVRRAYESLPEKTKASWLWIAPPHPADCPPRLAAILMPDDQVQWDDAAHTERLLSLMAPRHLAKVRAAQTGGSRTVGTLYKRTRVDGAGERAQRAEVRFDGIAGCLRTPRGGSSRQTVLVVEGSSVRTRLLHPREAARLMGLPDTYRLPERPNEAYHLLGDGVVVPVVRHLVKHLVEPALAAYEPERILRHVS